MSELAPASRPPGELETAAAAAAPAAEPIADPEAFLPKRVNDSPRREGILGLAIAFVFFGVFGGFAAFVPLDAAVYAVGEVTVAGHRQAVQHPEGGVVSRLLVSENQHVEKDQVLVELADNEPLAATQALTNSVLTLYAQRARLIAERDGQAQVSTPVEFGSLDPSEEAVARLAIAAQRREFGDRARARQAEISVLRQRIAQLEQQQGGSQKQVASAETQQQIIDQEIGAVRQLVEKGLAPQTRLRALERQRAELDGQTGEQTANAARAQEAIGETELQIASAQQSFKAQVAEELRQTELRLGELTPRWISEKARLSRTQVRAPASGRVVGLSVFTEGGVVGAGQTLMEIVPDTGDYLIEARAEPQDADDLRPGMRTEVRFSGLPNRRLPRIEGEVINVSADRLVDERSGLAYYRMEVRVPEAELARLLESLGDDDRIRPGIPAEVVVPLRGRTMLEYLTEPLTDSMWRSFREH